MESKVVIFFVPFLIDNMQVNAQSTVPVAKDKTPKPA